MTRFQTVQSTWLVNALAIGSSRGVRRPAGGTYGRGTEPSHAIGGRAHDLHVCRHDTLHSAHYIA
jgi:hypothetical protein